MTKIKTILSYPGKLLNNHPLIFFVILSFIENLTIESLSRHSLIEGVRHLFSNPLPFFLNALIIMFTLSFSLLFRRRVFGVVLFSTPWIVCGIINCVLLSYRVTPLGAIDFQIAKAGLVLMYLSMAQRILLYIGVAVFLGAIIALWIIGPKITGKINHGKSAASIVGLLLAVLISLNLARSIEAVSSDFGNLVGAYRDYGFVYCFSSSVLDTGIDEPENYSEETVRSLTEKFPETVNTENTSKPDVILIQLESFIDPKYIKDLTFSDDPAPIHSFLRENFSGGAFSVPSFGSGTANTEFEVLTGISMDNFGPGEYPYKTIMLEKPCESVAFNLKEIGYSTHAIHNHTGNFYDRDKVYPNMGFDSFQSKEYMYDFETTPYGWCKDKVLTEEIITALNHTEEDGSVTEDTPRFVWAVSVQGHGKYPSEPLPGAENVIKVESDKYTPEELYALSYYVNQMWEMDMFMGSLITALEQRGKPAIVIAYGDHLPSIGLGAENFDLPDVYTTEYVTWNNIGLTKERSDIYSYELSSRILGWLGFNNGNITKLHQLAHNNSEVITPDLQLEGMRILAYDMLYGGEYQFEVNPYEKTDMRMGTLPIKVDGIQFMGNSLYVKGSGFTEKSTVFINGEKQTTSVLSQHSLMVSMAKIQDGDTVTVGQSSSKREVLSYSDPIVYDTEQHYLSVK